MQFSTEISRTFERYVLKGLAGFFFYIAIQHVIGLSYKRFPPREPVSENTFALHGYEILANF